jgi:hypothetical protein
MSILNILKFNVISQPDPANPSRIIQSPQLGHHALFSGGIVMDIVIGVDAITVQSSHGENPIPPPIAVKALVDTGCTITSIDNSLVTALGLKVRGYNPIHTANGTTIASQHQVSLAFPGTNLAGRQIHTVQTANLTGQPFLVLIGRDLMASWSVTYNGPAGFVSISD